MVPPRWNTAYQKRKHKLELEHCLQSRPKSTDSWVDQACLQELEPRTFLFRVLRTWKGKIHFFSRSQATASQSKTNDLTPSLGILGRREMISGYFSERFSEFREKIVTFPSSIMWIYKTECNLCSLWKGSSVKYTCARSPSYLYSQINVIFSNRSKTSVILLVGCANIGFSGMPGVNWQCSGNTLYPCLSIAPMILS